MNSLTMSVLILCKSRPFPTKFCDLRPDHFYRIAIQRTDCTGQGIQYSDFFLIESCLRKILILRSNHKRRQLVNHWHRRYIITINGFYINQFCFHFACYLWDNLSMLLLWIGKRPHDDLSNAGGQAYMSGVKNHPLSC